MLRTVQISCHLSQIMATPLNHWLRVWMQLLTVGLVLFKVLTKGN